MTYNNLLINGENLLNKSGLEKHIAKLILLDVSGLTTNEFILKMNEIPPKRVVFKYNKLLNKHLKKTIPPQYLLKKAYFYGNQFYVNKNVLIPRGETEGLVELTIKEINKFNNTLNIIDVGTGSGCISITLNKEFINHNVYAIDISKRALRVARRNNKNHLTNVKFILSDLFNNVKDIKFDVIVANLPYVRENEVLGKMESYEPKNALYAGEDGTLVYQRFFKEVFNYLNDNGVILIEHEYLHGKIIEEFILNVNSNVKVERIKDLANKDRYIIVRGFINE